MALRRISSVRERNGRRASSPSTSSRGCCPGRFPRSRALPSPERGSRRGLWAATTTTFSASATLALVLGDVCGKGIPAALLMANLQATVKAYAMEEASPKEVCRKVNRAVSGSTTQGRFITFFYAVLDSTRRRLTYVNAGHNPPFDRAKG